MNMNDPFANWEAIEVGEKVKIPTPDGNGVAEVISVTVPARRDPATGKVYFGAEAIRIMDDVRARHMGLLTTDEIREIRIRRGLTQARMAELLRLGLKTWTRWESGRERPSQSMNVLICALRDGRITVSYLEELRKIA
jgi:DNA-binding transcriptional regulator YiaG